MKNSIQSGNQPEHVYLSITHSMNKFMMTGVNRNISFYLIPSQIHKFVDCVSLMKELIIINKTSTRLGKKTFIINFQ